MNLMDLFVKISVDDQASSQVETIGSKLKGGLATAAKVGAAAVGAVTAATGALYTGITAAAGSVAAYGDNIDKMSQKMGMSAEAYQEWDAVMQHSGTSIESLQAGMKTLANAVESGNDAFERLGISQEEIAKMSNEDLFSATITALQNVENETERTYLAGQLLGRGATELGALLNTSAEDTQAMKDRVHELGGVMSDEAVKASARYQDSLQDMKTSFSGLKNSLIADFLPGMSTVMDGIASLVIGEDSAQSTISSGVSQIIESMNSSLPRFFDAGKQIVEAIFQAITQNLPQMVSGGIEMLMSIVDGIIENLPLLVESAAKIIVTFANGIAERLPELIPTIVDVVIQIVETLIDNVDMLVDASIEIMVALADGLINALPKLIEKVPVIITKLIEAYVNNAPKMIEASLKIIVALAEGLIKSIPELIKAIPQIVTAIVNGFKNYMSQIKDIGKNIVSGVWEGIQSMASWITGKVKSFFSGIVDGVKGVLGIHSPSRVFAGIGENMALGLSDGWDSEYNKIKRNITNGLDFGTATIDAKATMSGKLQNALTNIGNIGGDINIVVQSVLDGKIIGETAYKYNRQMQRAMGV